MATSANQDSALELSFGPVAGFGEYALPTVEADADALGVAATQDLVFSGRANFDDELPIFDLLSDAPLPDTPDVMLSKPPAARAQPASNDGRGITVPTTPSDHPHSSIWIEGDVLMCGCPDCRAPMTIRLWLMIADCWQCGTSLELNEEQEREAMRLLQQREQAKRRGEQPRAAPATPAKSTPAAPRQPAPQRAAGTAAAAALAATAPLETPTRPKQEPSKAPGQRPAQPGTPPPRFKGQTPSTPPPATTRQTPPAPQSPPRERRRVTEPPKGPRARMRQMVDAGATTVWLNDLFKLTPAWLVSLVFHFVVLTLLALFTFGDEDTEPFITLTASVSKDVQEGGQVVVNPQDDVKFDLPLPKNVDLNDPQQRQAMIRADQDARELRIDPNTPNPQLPDLQKVKAQIGDKSGIRQTFAARDPRVRVEMVKQEGGTTLSEAAVARALLWMSNHQSDDGSWSLDRFNRTPGCTCGGAGGIHSDSAGTALVLLPFLGAGQSHITGRYKDNVSKGLRWLVQHQKPDGDLRANSAGNSGMYAHGQATIVLCEAFAMEGDEALRIPAQRAVDFIAKAQHQGGGWRYAPGQPGDTSVVGWQLMGLQSARAAGLDVSNTTLELASQYLDSVGSNDGSQYAYTRGQRPTHVMTAEALLCRMYLGWTNENYGLRKGVEFLAKNHLPTPNTPDIYYWYYGTQTFHHAGGPEWELWNEKMRDILVNSQEKAGHQAGSWTPKGSHSASGGRIYETALSTCTLEVYYRHLPIFRQIKLD
jgi:hypothetical protein